MTKDLFDKYIWLVDTIHRAGRITLREINEKWAMSPLYDGADIPRRTFNNWKEAIQQAFDINIECRRTGGYHYYIENPEDLENSTTRSWLLNTFTVKNIISESKGIRDRILLENVPSGQKHLTPIIDAHPPRERTFRTEASHPHHRRHAGQQMAETATRQLLA